MHQQGKETQKVGKEEAPSAVTKAKIETENRSGTQRCWLCMLLASLSALPQMQLLLPGRVKKAFHIQCLASLVSQSLSGQGFLIGSA